MKRVACTDLIRAPSRQNRLGADIIMALDDVVPSTATVGDHQRSCACAPPTSAMRAAAAST